MDSQELDFLSEYSRFLKYWYFLAIAAILGGVLGWLFSQIQPPVYDAQTKIDVTVDLAQTGNLSTYKYDQAVGAIQGVFYSTKVLSRVSELAEKSLPADYSANLYKQVGMERNAQTWILRIRDENPETAAFLVNTWLEVGFEELSQAREHSMNARSLQRYLASVENCPSPPEIEPPILPICQDYSTIDEAAVKEIQARIQDELAKGQAIQPYLIFNRHSPAGVPEEPVMYQTKWLVLGGMFSLFIVTILFLQFYQPIQNPRN